MHVCMDIGRRSMERKLKAAKRIRERGRCGAGVGQATANFGLKGMLCFFRRVRNSAAKGIFLWWGS